MDNFLPYVITTKLKELTVFSASETMLLIFVPIFLILAVFLWSLASFARSTFGLESELKQFLKLLSSPEEPSPSELSNFFEEKGKRKFGNLWKVYKSKWVELDNSQAQLFNSQLYSTEEASSFFNAENCLDARVNMEWYQTVPSILTGLGILFTFLGLSLGLFSLENIGTPLSKASDIGPQLFKGASLAFPSSVAGLACSLVFSWILKRKIHSIISKVDDIALLLDLRIPFLSPQKVSLLNLAMARRSSESEERIKKLFENFSTSTVNELRNVTIELTKEFSKGLENKISATAGLFTNGAQKMNESLAVLSASISDMEQKLQQSGNVLVENFSKVDESTRNTLNQLEKENSHLSEAIQKSSKELESQLLTFTKEFNKTIADTQKEISAALEQTGLLLVETVRKELEKIEESTRRSKDLLSQINHIYGEETNSINPVLAVLKQVRGLSEEFEKMAPRLISSLEELGPILTSSVKEIEKFKEISSGLIENFKAVSYELNATCVDLKESITEVQSNFDTSSLRHAQNLENSLNALDLHISKAIEFLGNSVNSWNNSLNKTIKN